MVRCRAITPRSGVEGGTRTLRDLDSANGTTVNGEPITEWVLKDGDAVCFGMIQAAWVARPPPPAAIAPASVMEVVQPLPSGRRALVLGVALLVALSAVVFLVSHRRHANSRPPEVAGIDKDQGQRTKMFWDKIHQIENTGNAQGKQISFGGYPKLETGMFDFRWFDDKTFESFLGKLDTRSQRANQVAAEISQLDKSDVDADLLAYTNELCTQWKSASDLDLYFARYISALYKQHKEPELAPSQGDTPSSGTAVVGETR